MKIDEKTGLYGNYGIWHTPFWQTYTFKVAMIVLGSLVFIALVFVCIRYYLSRRVIPSWDVALNQVRQLKDSAISGAQEGKELYTGLVAIMKKYVHARYGYDILGKTDKEVIAYLQEINAEDTLVRDMQALMYESETMRFADAAVAKDQFYKDCDFFVALVERTKITKGK